MTFRIRIVDYDPRWPGLFLLEAERIRSALRQRALRIEHAGSTSVPGLAAKPVIDIVLVVEDSSDEAAYAPPLEGAGYSLHLREPDWHEHRLLKRRDPETNLHVFSDRCPEIARMLQFRDRLRRNTRDRELYVQTKRELARREWNDIEEYAAAKTSVINAILARAFGSIETPAAPPIAGAGLDHPASAKRDAAASAYAPRSQSGNGVRPLQIGPDGEFQD
jgi:GrpB-like predicted nucleotidyltransferase (UPF0157 family)